MAFTAPALSFGLLASSLLVAESVAQTPFGETGDNNQINSTTAEAVPSNTTDNAQLDVIAIPSLTGVVSLENGDETAPAEQIYDKQVDPTLDKTQVSLTADSFEEDQISDTITAIGNVEAAYEGRIMRADRAVYSRETKRLHAKGNVIIIDEDGTERFADEFEMTTDLKSGYAVNFAIRMADGGRAVASSVVRYSNGTDVLDNIIYTACETCEDENPTWALKSKRAIRNEETGLISYRGTVLEVGGVPVFYTPFLAHPDPSIKRQSGLLFPDVGVSSKLGTFYQQPVFYVISPSSDILVSPQLSTNVNPFVEMRYRKRFWSGDIDIETSFTNETEFDSRGNVVFRDENGFYIEEPDTFLGEKNESEETFRGHIFARGLFDLNDTWQWGFGVENQTDALYDRRYSIDGLTDLRGIYYSQTGRFLSQLFTRGQTQNFYAEASVLGFQNQVVGLNNDATPTVAPLLFATRDVNLGGFGKLTFDYSAASLDRKDSVDSRRNSLAARWSAQKIYGGVVVSPFLEGRADHYGFDTDFSAEPDKSRLVGSVGANLSYPLIKYSQSGTFTIEPEILIAHSSSNANDPIIPNEDSVATELNWTTLLQADGIYGYDLFEGDSKAAVSLKTTAQLNNGVNINTRIGRRWRSRADTALSAATNLDGNVSDWMFNTEIQLASYLNLSTDLRLDDETLEPNRIDLTMRGNAGRLSGSVNYFKAEASASVSNSRVEGIAISGQARITDRITANYSTIRDINLNQNYAQTYGLSYSDDCAVFQVYYRVENYDNAVQKDSTSFGFAFTLKTLGTLGSSEFD